MCMKTRREIAVIKDEVIIIEHFLQFALQLKFPVFVKCSYKWREYTYMLYLFTYWIEESLSRSKIMYNTVENILCSNFCGWGVRI